MSNAILTVHVGGVRRTREELAGLGTPEPTASWKPVPHATLVGELVGALEEHEVRVVREDYATLGRDHARLFGVMDVRVPTWDAPDYGLAVGLSAANDKSMAIRVMVAARVFVCDNLAFSGSGGAVLLRKVHSPGLDLPGELRGAVDEYLEKAGQFRMDLESMKGVGLGEGEAKALIHDAFAGRGGRAVMPVRLFPEVSRLYFDDDEQRARFPDRTLWSLNNSFTEAVKALRPALQHRAGLAVGRHFGRALRQYAASN